MSGAEPPAAPASGPKTHKQVLIAYAAMDICNPLSFATLDKVLDNAWDLAPGARTLDLGCANAAVSMHLARRYGLEVDALERAPAVAQIAAERLRGFEGPGSVRLHVESSKTFLPLTDPYDLIVALGVSGVVEGPPEPAAVLAALAPHLRPGGWLLWGDPYLRREPSPQFTAMMGGYAAYLGNAENVAAGEAAGLTCVTAATSSEQDWDDYTWRINAAVERWLADNPGDPDADSVRMRARFLRTAYLIEGRETLGFGLYLFRKP